MAQVILHPQTLHMLRQGHPWITEDSYTKRFPLAKKILEGLDENKQVFCQLIHDPAHKKVKARLWHSTPPFPDFKTELLQRLKISFDKRRELLSERENFYWCFGESDQLPGLFILNLGPVILFQYYAYFWESSQADLINFCQSYFTSSEKTYWSESRGTGKPAKKISGNAPAQFAIKEHNFLMQVTLGEWQDHGLYTDMAAIRKELLPLYKENGKVLNLFSYTGAFSVQALQNKSAQVVSVDLSSVYLKQLEHNLALNNFPKDKHRSIAAPVLKAMDELIKQQEKFDLIICDPPSSSSDGKKRISALAEYERLLPLMSSLLNSKGHLVVFLNTHDVSWAKFENTLLKWLKPNQLKLLKRIKLKEDCVPIKGFPEGDYLKGLLLQKH